MFDKKLIEGKFLSKHHLCFWRLRSQGDMYLLPDCDARGPRFNPSSHPEAPLSSLVYSEREKMLPEAMTITRTLTFP